MKRTSSGSDLSGKTILDSHATTPYVYMRAASDKISTPMSPNELAAAAEFRVHCAGGTVTVPAARLGATPATCALDSFIAEVQDGAFLAGLTLPLGGEDIFIVPLSSIARVRVLRPSGTNAHVWAFLCGCCFGARDRVLALDLDAPAGWLQAEPGLAGPVRLSLFVRDVDDWLDAMDIRHLVDG